MSGTDHHHEKPMTRPFVIRDVLFVFLGVGGLLLKGRYSGPWAQAVHCWGGNVTASFAVFFIFKSSMVGRKHGALAAAALAFATVQLFEVTNGFGVMTNVFDPFDLAANPIGIGLALAADYAAGRLAARRETRPARAPEDANGRA